MNGHVWSLSTLLGPPPWAIPEKGGRRRASGGLALAQVAQPGHTTVSRNHVATCRGRNWGQVQCLLGGRQRRVPKLADSWRRFAVASAVLQCTLLLWWEGAELEGKALDLLVHAFQPLAMLMSFGYWTQEWGCGFEHLKGVKFHHWVIILSLGDRVRSSEIRMGARGTAAASVHQKEPTEVVLASHGDAPWASPMEEVALLYNDEGCNIHFDSRSRLKQSPSR